MTKPHLRSRADYPPTSGEPFVPSDATRDDVAYVVMYRKDYYSTPTIQCITLDEKKAQYEAYQLAKRKFRYSGIYRESYTYFDQDIRIETFRLT